MNDRAVSILEQYDLVVEKTWKGRGAILFETKDGVFILKEYKGALQRLPFVARQLKQIRENGYLDIEELIPNKEGEYYCTDYDRTVYIVKRYFQAKECNIKEKAEYLRGIKALANLHKAMIDMPGNQDDIKIDQLPIIWEFQKHNTELRRVRRYLKGKGQKSDFERYLVQHYDYFYDQAADVMNQLQNENIDAWLSQIQTQKMLCHGEYQYHNILLDDKNCYIINFEKMTVDNPVKDVYLFVRKLLEKNNWDLELGRALLHTYNKERALEEYDTKQLYYRLLYPEKFWKIVNFYYNNSKAWISCKNTEKLDKLLQQEEEKRRLLKAMFES